MKDNAKGFAKSAATGKLPFEDAASKMGKMSASMKKMRILLEAPLTIDN